MTTVELEKTFRGITCSLNVLVQLSEPAYPSTLRKSLSKHQIHKEFVSLIKICLRFQFKTPPRLKQLLKHKPKMMQMLRLWRSRILTFLDHFSNDKQFAILFDETDFDGESDSLPALWQFLMAVLVERVGGSDDEWAMNKARCIRTLYRWAARLNQIQSASKSPSPSVRCGTDRHYA